MNDPSAYLGDGEMVWWIMWSDTVTTISSVGGKGAQWGHGWLSLPSPQGPLSSWDHRNIFMVLGYEAFQKRIGGVGLTQEADYTLHSMKAASWRCVFLRGCCFSCGKSLRLKQNPFTIHTLGLYLLRPGSVILLMENSWSFLFGVLQFSWWRPGDSIFFFFFPWLKPCGAGIGFSIVLIGNDWAGDRTF